MLWIYVCPMDPALRSMTGDCTFWIWGVHPNSWRGCLGRDPWSLSCPNCVIGFDHTIYVYRYIYIADIYNVHLCLHSSIWFFDLWDILWWCKNIEERCSVRIPVLGLPAKRNTGDPGKCWPTGQLFSFRTSECTPVMFTHAAIPSCLKWSINVLV